MRFLKAIVLIGMMNLPLLSFGQEMDATSDSTYLIQEGIASYYGQKFHNRKTSNGERFNMDSLTAAHKSLPFGTILKVTSIRTGKTVWVRINDRLPQSSSRIIDLSRAAAKSIDMITMGITKVRLEVPSQSNVLALKDYYKERKPVDIRLRIYEDFLNIQKPNITHTKNFKDLRSIANAKHPLMIKNPQLKWLAGY
jgi:rare lipoprotein A